MVLPRLGSYNKKLLHYVGTKAHRTTLLEVLDMHRTNLEALLDISQKGKGSFVKGVAVVMDDIAKGIVGVSTGIFHLIARGTTEIANDTSTAVSGVGKAIASVFSFSGGASNFLLYVINAGVIVYLIYKHIKEQRRGHKRPRGPVTIVREGGYLVDADRQRRNLQES